MKIPGYLIAVIVAVILVGNDGESKASQTTWAEDGGRSETGVAAVGVDRFDLTRLGQVLPDMSWQPLVKQDATLQLAQGMATTNTAKPVSTSVAATVFEEKIVRDVGRGNLPAFKLLVPQGWKFESQLQMVPAYNNVPYFGEFNAKAPDGRHVSFAPFSEFGFSDQVRGQPMQPYLGRPFFRRPGSLGQALMAIAQLDPQQKMTNIEIISEEVLPDATEMVRRMHANAAAQAANYSRQNAILGERWFYNIDVRRLVMRFTEDGKRLESMVFAVVGSNTIVYANGSVKTANWTISDLYSVGGPVGSNYTQDPVLAAIVRSRQMNADWAYAIDQWYAGARNRIIREGAARAAIANRSWQNARGKQADDVLDISFAGWKKRNAISDASQSRQVNLIHERTTYATPSGSQVNLPSFYQNAYTDGQGKYVLHHDANYNIHTDPAFSQQNWQRIEKVE